MRTFRNATRELDNDTFGGDFWIHKPYKPNLRAQAPRISKEEWQKHEARIRELHAEGYTSERARQILRNESQDANGCFSPSAAQYAAQLKALGLRTYSTKKHHDGTQENGLPNDFGRESMSGDIGYQQRQIGYNIPFDETLPSIPEGRDISDVSSASPVDSTFTPDSMSRSEISDTDELTTDLVSVGLGYAAAGVAKDIPLTGVNPSLTGRAICDTLDDTYVLEDAGPLLTFLSIVEPGFAYEPTSAVLSFWPQLDGNATGVTWSMLEEVGKVADYLHAAQSYADAFDLYYTIFCHLHKTLDTDIRQHLITAVLNCAQSSSTSQQDECAIAVLRLILRDQNRGTGDHISAGALNLYLGELYRKQRNQKSEGSTMTAIQYLAETCRAAGHQRTVLELGLPRPLHTSILLQSKTIPPQYACYFTSDSETRASQLTRDIVSHTVSKKLLKWCADVIARKAKYLNNLASILTGDAPTMKDCIRQLLLCCCFELWLKASKRTTGAGRYFSEAKSTLKESEMPWLESVSAITLVIVKEAFRDSNPLAAVKRRFTTKTFASHLVRTIKAMLGRISETDQSFTNMFLASVVASGDDREPSRMDELSRTVAQVFAGNLASSGILSEQQGGLATDNIWQDLTPAPADLFKDTVRQMFPAPMLYTPRSSFSSGARSLRALHAELDQISITSLSTSKSKGSSGASWPQSRRSSWSFNMITGIGRESRLHIPELEPDGGLGNLSTNLEDTVMVDV